jgi:hypothetical protein
MLTRIIVVIEGDWRLLGILNRISAEELDNNHTVSVWHLEGGRMGGHIERWLRIIITINSQTGNKR